MRSPSSPRGRASSTLAGIVSLGDGTDQVGIENGTGRACIVDFAAGAAGDDIIDVSAFFSSFDELLAYSHEHGGDVVIALHHNDHLTLRNLRLSELHGSDFLFA